jgi:excisionase family DNA binding protein
MGLVHPGETREPRFLTLADVAEILATSVSQVRALVKSRELRAIQIGGRGQWRVEAVELEKYIARMYAQADAGELDEVDEADQAEQDHQTDGAPDPSGHPSGHD